MIRSGETLDTLGGKIIALVFETPSTRTRVSFESATARLGGTAMYLQGDTLKMAGGEPVSDTARVLSGYCDCIVARVWPHSKVVDLAEHASVPVVNALTDVDHPTQAIADLFTLREAIGDLRGRRFAFVGTGNNMCNALMYGSAMAGLNMSIACPSGLEPNAEILGEARLMAADVGATISVGHDPQSAVIGADAVYTDIWEIPGGEDISLRGEIEWERYRVDDDLIALAAPDAVVMHCGDAERGNEITAELMTSERSIIWEQAENKVYAGGAVLEYATRTRCD